MSYEYSSGNKIRDQYGLHFMTFTIVGGIDLFSRKVYRDILLKNMQYCREHKGLLIGGFVIMSDHAHVIWQSTPGKLSDTLRDFKSYSTKEFIHTIINTPETRKDWLLHMFRFHANRTEQNKEFKVWTGDNEPIEIHSEEQMKQRLNYMHTNPVRAGLVKNAEDYIYSSASNYMSGNGLIEIDYLY